MKRLRFYKEESGKWYVDLPEWTGHKEELQMISGADMMLDIMSEGETQVFLTMSLNYFGGSDKLELIRLADEIGNGAYYKLDYYRGVNIGIEMWLCDVTKFVFDDFPKEIFISSTLNQI